MKVNRVLLVASPALTFREERDINPLPPMGLGYLASVIEGMGIEVKILDCLARGWNNEEDVTEDLMRVGMSDRDIEEYIAKFDPDIVGINCQFSRQYRMYHNMLSLVKKVKPDCITIAGGAHVTVCPEEVLTDPNCDFILTGEAEESFEAFLNAIYKDNGLGQIDGLGWKLNGNLKMNEKKRWIENLDLIRFPAYHLMDLDIYFGLNASHGLRHKTKFSPIITTRGCPAKCTFCSVHNVWGKPYRVRSVENVIEEMSILRNKYGIEELMFEDDNVTANPKRAAQLFTRMIEEKFDFIWDTPNGVGIWSINESIIDLMKKSGCVKLNFPVESGSQHVLKNIIKKPLNLEMVKRLTKYCRSIGLPYGMFLVIGMPGETLKDMWTSIKFAADCGCYDPHISVATPYPGTVLFDDCNKKGYFAREFSLDHLFIRGFLIETPDWSGDDIRKLLNRGIIYLKFREVLTNPQKIKWAFQKLMKPSLIVNWIKKII